MRVDGRVLQDSLELRYEDGKGYHVKAKRELSAGSVVFEEKPCAAALPWAAARRLCRSCLMLLQPRLLEDPIKCARCHFAYYCSQRCRKNDSAPHEATGECFLLQNSKVIEELGGYVREACLALRLLQCKREDPPFLSNWDKFIGPHAGSASHLLCVMAPAVSKATQDAAAADVPGAAARDNKSAAEAICQVFTNAVEVLPSMPVACTCSSQLTSSGPPAAAMYGLVCRINHSCRANAAYHFKPGGAVVVRTTVDVEENEEVCISYLDPMQPLARREADLLHRFCFKCQCERCQFERKAFEAACQSPATGTDQERSAGNALPPVVPTWFLSAVAPAGLPEDAPAAEVQAAANRARGFLEGLLQQAEDLFVGQGNAAAAWSALESGVLQAVKMGVHPYHHRCLEFYSCLTSACRVCAKFGMGAAALRRAALFGLLQAGAAEAVVAAGEYGAIPQAARNWSETGALLCEVLAAEVSELMQAGSSAPDLEKRRSIPTGGIDCEHAPGGSAQESNPSPCRALHEQQWPRGHSDPEQDQSDAAGRRPETEEKMCEDPSSSMPAQAASQQQQQQPLCSESSRKRRRVGDRDAAPCWPDLAPEAAGTAAARRLDGGRGGKSVPEPPPDFAAAVCATWRALATDPQQRDGDQQGDEPAQSGGRYHSLGHPAAFLSCAAPAPVNDDLVKALQLKLGGTGVSGADIERLQYFGNGATHCLAHAAGLLKVVAGLGHPLTESAAFCAFFSGLPYSIACVITRSVTRLLGDAVL